MQERVCDSSSLFCWGSAGRSRRQQLFGGEQDGWVWMNRTRCENNRLFAYNLVKMISNVTYSYWCNHHLIGPETTLESSAQSDLLLSRRGFSVNLGVFLLTGVPEDSRMFMCVYWDEARGWVCLMWFWCRRVCVMIQLLWLTAASSRSSRSGHLDSMKWRRRWPREHRCHHVHRVEICLNILTHTRNLICTDVNWTTTWLLNC